MARTIYALLVGIDNYPPGVAPLDGCVNDITNMELYLNERVQNAQVKTLKNEEATYKAIIKGFREHLCQAGSEDTALFYYAGHGSQEQAPEQFWAIEPDHLNETLVCYDSRTSVGWDLADKELAKLISEVAAKNPHIIMILDCCHSGSGTRDPMLEVKERRLETDTRIRPIETYLVSGDEAKGFASGSRDPNAAPAGWTFSQGRHVLLAACRSSQTAKEYKGGGQPRGAFSYFFQEALKKANPTTTYRDLFGTSSALVASKISDQAPQLEAIVSDDLNIPFLGGAVVERTPYFVVRRHPDYGWVIDGGSVHGVPAPSGSETMQLALFDSTVTAEQLRKVGDAIARAEVTEVLPQLSKIKLIGLDNPPADTTYRAVVTGLPLPPLGVRLEGDEAGVALVREALLKTADTQAPSLYVKETTEADQVEFRVIAKNGEYLIARPADDRPLVKQIENYTSDSAQTIVQRLEHIAKWSNIAELTSPPTSRIAANAVKIQIFQGDEEITAPQIRLQYGKPSSDGKPNPPKIKIKLTNTTSKDKLYCAILDLTDTFGISAGVLPAGGIWLDPGTSVWARDDQAITVMVKDELWNQKITEVKDILKLLVSTVEFDARLMEQGKLDTARSRDVTRGSGKGSTLNRFMNRVQARDLEVAGAEDQCDDWMTTSITFTCVRPLDTTAIAPSRDAVDLGSGVTVQPHPGLKAEARLSTITQATRDLGSLITPPILRGDPALVQPFQFTTSRGTDPGLSSLELTDVDSEAAKTVTPTQPLRLTIDTSLAEDERILPVAYDGEFFLPLGVGQGRNGQTEITIDRLPEPVSKGERSLGGAIRIFFQKIITQKLGMEFTYPLLSMVQVAADDTVRYESDPDNIRSRLASAEKIVIFIHGIIGDTLSMVPSVNHARVRLADGQEKSLAQLYDVVLAFDYENLNTPIEENGRLLKQRLEAVGLGAGHGKVVHIVAHSMGGLVSRWFIEQEGGNQMVTHLIMLGTPNGGSPWPKVEEMATSLLAIGLNSLSVIALPVPMLSVLLKAIDTARGKLDRVIDISLTQMMPGSEFLTNLANSPDPGIPYTVLAGNTSLVPAAMVETADKGSPIARLMTKVFDTAVALPFFNQPNDIAVTVPSIKNVSMERSPQPIKTEVGCNHLVYFIHNDGLNALVMAAVNALSQPPVVPPTLEAEPLGESSDSTAAGGVLDSETGTVMPDPGAIPVTGDRAIDTGMAEIPPTLGGESLIQPVDDLKPTVTPTSIPGGSQNVPQNAGNSSWLIGLIVGFLACVLLFGGLSFLRGGGDQPVDTPEGVEQPQ
ncbi:MAG: caspase [Leptolyngbyaceae cyanobacterium SL_7_1]|nr:caspase [Leptolyngbyaceae cyanobacterium SL_7_1]